MSLDWPFLEAHRTRRRAQKGSDRTRNAVALCPNCHQRLIRERTPAVTADALPKY
ncbi:HNH endonuclease [Pseudomonas sp. Marseille-Q1929]|nr:HNH endonuclease [Pseudomonas sp. Marseille-Q1929]